MQSFTVSDVALTASRIMTATKRWLVAIAAILPLCLFGQSTPAQSQDDVLRINTELVQTRVSVFDKQGQFVDGLKREDFELVVGGRAVSLSFFENIIAGSRREQRAQLGQGAPENKAEGREHSYRQRTVVFFIDDLHLSLDSSGRTRKTLLQFIDRQMGQNDLVAIASSSGRIGFLQQFSNSKDVLRAAVARLSHVPYVVSDYGGNPSAPLTEYMALTIERRDDPRVFEFYVEDCLKWAARGASPRDRRAARQQCEIQVVNRARQILIQAGGVTTSTYYAFETLLGSAEKMLGSKLAFFISDGFLSDTGPRASVGSNKLNRITEKARRAGVVIYTIDARGLISGESDATNSVPFDPNGRLESAHLRQVASAQDGLNALAADTGGQALRNQHQFGWWVTKAMDETSRYYLLGWRPETAGEKNLSSSKIEVRVRNRRDLVVRSAQGFFNSRQSAESETKLEQKADEVKSHLAEKISDADLRQALADFQPKNRFPLYLSLFYLDTPANGTLLTSSIQAGTANLSYGADGTNPARLTLAGVVLNDQGKPQASFKTQLKVNPATSVGTSDDPATVIYNHKTPLKPGIYQVRVAARDDGNGVVGSNMEWIVIPDLSKQELSLSSLIVGLGSVVSDKVATAQIQWSVDKKFAHSSRLSFMTFIYNAQSSPRGRPDLTAQVSVYRDQQAVLSTGYKAVPVETQTDAARIPFASDVNLGTLPAGRYVLRVTVEDRITKKTATQDALFEIQ